MVVNSDRCFKLTRCAASVSASFIKVVVHSEKESHVIRFAQQLELLVAHPEWVGQIVRTPAWLLNHLKTKFWENVLRSKHLLLAFLLLL